MVTQKQQDEFLAFRQSCIWLRNCYNIFNHLFHSGPETEMILRRIAPHFFTDLNSILQDYFFLQVRRITDKPKNRERKNLSLQYINEELEAKNLMTQEIRRLSESIASYRELTSDISNRVVAHADKETTLNSALVGIHTKQELESFLESIQAYTDAVGIALGVGPLDYSVQADSGDVIDLLTALKRA